MSKNPPAQKHSFLKGNKNKKHAEIDLYGVVGWSIDHRYFNAELKRLGDLETITVNLNTIGGTFYDGLPIYNILKQHKAHVTIRVMGYALSMGSIIMLAGDTVEMAQNSLVMIHRAQGAVWGDARDMESGAARLKVHEEAILPDYMNRLGKTEAEVMELLQAETWYSSKSALKAGFIDKITDPIDLKKANKQIDENVWEESIQNFQNMPDDFIQNVQENMPKSMLEKIINLMPGQPQPLILPENQQEDLEMTKEELQEMLDAQSEKMEASMQEKIEVAVAKALEEPELTEEQKEIADLKAKLAEKDANKGGDDDADQTNEEIIEAKEKQIADLQAETEELKKPAGDATPTPENKGDNGDIKYDC